MRIAFLTEMFPKISETFILNQMTGLLDEGYKITIFSDHNPEEPIQHTPVDEYNLIGGGCRRL